MCYEMILRVLLECSERFGTDRSLYMALLPSGNCSSANFLRFFTAKYGTCCRILTNTDKRFEAGMGQQHLNSHHFSKILSK